MEDISTTALFGFQNWTFHDLSRWKLLRKLDQVGDLLFPLAQGGWGHFTGWWQLKYFLELSPRKLGKMNPFWTNVFQMVGSTTNQFGIEDGFGLRFWKKTVGKVQRCPLLGSCFYWKLRFAVRVVGFCKKKPLSLGSSKTESLIWEKYIYGGILYIYI